MSRATWLMGAAGALTFALVAWVVCKTSPLGWSREYAYLWELVRASGVPLPDPWGLWLESYQSFVAGCLAAIAAIATIFQMRLSDTRAEKQHRDQILVAQYHDRVRVDRANAVYRARLESIVASFGELGSIPTSGDWTDEMQSYCEQARKAGILSRQILTLIGSPHWADASALFDGELTKALEDLRAHATLLPAYSDALVGHFQKWALHRANWRESVDPSRSQLAAALFAEKYNSALAKTKTDTSQVLAGLDRLLSLFNRNS